jgi:hypothetical protein
MDIKLLIEYRQNMTDLRDDPKGRDVIDVRPLWSLTRKPFQGMAYQDFLCVRGGASIPITSTQTLLLRLFLREPEIHGRRSIPEKVLRPFRKASSLMLAQNISRLQKTLTADPRIPVMLERRQRDTHAPLVMIRKPR